ncbi:protein tyrosine phosphatase [Saccharothrix sp. AJ9571]|nr:protein tyrosine phosphatase [Saccharothrix sp. AJ9571]
MSVTQLTGAIELPDGSWVRGRGLRRGAPEGDPPDHGLYLGTRVLRRSHGGHIAWAQEWISWPDFLLPLDRQAAVTRIRALHALAKEGHRVEIACGGGVGRTGTVMACLARLAGVPGGEAVAWTREHYHPRAVETPWQHKWVARFPA